MDVARHAWSTQNKKYALSFKKKLTYKVDALHADKHESVFYKLIALFVMDFTGQFTQVNLQYICDILKLETQLPKKKNVLFASLKAL